MEATIREVSAKLIRDSEDKNTIETTVEIDNGVKGIFAVPSGESTGGYEAFLLDPEKAVFLINTQLRNILVGKSFQPQGLDEFLISTDGSLTKSNFGANTILSISVAFFKALANLSQTPLYQLIQQYANITSTTSFKIPRLMVNIIEGGKHAPGSIDFQEFLLLPKSDNVQKGVSEAKEVIEKLKVKFPQNIAQGMEGGLCIKGFETNEEALRSFVDVANEVGKDSFDISLDVAANSFKTGGEYLLKGSPTPLSTQEMITFYSKLVNEYRVYSIEDPFSEDEWSGWESLHTAVRGKTKLIGDDLTVTNLQRLEEALKIGAIDGIIVKPNQIGTLSETLRVVKRAKENDLVVIVSHRARETMDDFIADLAVGLGADFLKAGAPTQPQRLAKYQRLSAIQAEITN